MSISIKRSATCVAGFALAVSLVAAGCQSDDLTAPDQVAVAQPGTINVSAAPSEVNAPWFLLQPDEDVVEGAGSTTLEEMPSGEYQLVWAPVPGWKSPTPNPVEDNLAAGGEISFIATYTAIQVDTGNIAVDAEPNEIDAPWTLTGPSGFFFDGHGDMVLNDREPGVYTLTFRDVANYQTAGPVQGTLVAGSRLDLGGSYVYQAPPATGTILVDVTPDATNAPWTLNGPDNYMSQGSGDISLPDMPVGTYSISFGAVNGWISPVPAQQSSGLVADQTLRFIGAYSMPGAPVLQTVQGALSPRGTVTIVGDAFGSHTLDYEWTGNWIEDQAVGTNPAAKPGWNYVYSSQGIRDHISNERAWSGSKSMDLSVDQTLDPWSSESTLSYLREPFETIYASWWSYIEPLAHSPIGTTDFTQIKHVYVTTEFSMDGRILQAITNSAMNVLRISKTSSQPNTFWWEVNTWVDCTDKPAPFLDVWNDAYGASYPMQSQPYWRPAITGGASDFGNVRTFAPSMGSWSRQELYMYRGSGPDVPDGEVQWIVTKPGQGRFVGTDAGGVVLQTARTDCRSEPDPWQRFVFMLFFDDPSQGDRSERCDMFIDDVYLQFGTRARVEIGDRAAYASCTRLEVQPVAGWNQGSIDITVNYGGFSSGDDVYLFVVRQDGAVSTGYPVRLP